MKTHYKKPVVAIMGLFCLTSSLLVLTGCRHAEEYYTIQDFESVPKIDAHFHYFMKEKKYMDSMAAVNFRLLSPNVDSGHPVDAQQQLSEILLRSAPEQFAYLCTFSVADFGAEGFSDAVVRHIRECMEQGARGVKIWKNIGMELTDAQGSYVMVTDAAFKPIFDFLETNDIPVLAHLGEPRNCWLPLEEMTDSGDRAYYRDHPQYHMYLHPEMPSYEDQIEARDRILELYPKLNLVGAHLGSLEWNVDELAKRLDRFPNFNVDMAARIGHLKNQSKEDWQRVRNFLVKYQDRVLYATDMELFRLPGQMSSHSFDRIRNVWLNDWIYFVSDSIVHDIKGLKLPREVIDKIYFRNAERIYDKY